MTVGQALKLGDEALITATSRTTGALRQLTLKPLALYSAAAVRIGLAGLYLLYLLREMGHADRLWGPGSPYTPDLFQSSAAARGWDDDLLGWWYTWLGTESQFFFWSMYGAAVIVSALYLLGWHTRVMAVLFAFLVAAFYLRGSVANSGFELLSLLLALYLVCCASGRRWSLDARRMRRRPTAAVGLRWGTETEELRRRVVTVLHNAGVGLIAFQVMVIYAVAAMYKIRGVSWRDGSALYYSLHLDHFATWPELSNWLASHNVWMALLAYATVFSQMLFPALVFNQRLKYCILVIMLSTHVGIGLLMALPMFSAITIVGDLIFLPTAFWLRATAVARTLRAPAEEESVPEHAAPPNTETRPEPAPRGA